MLVFFYCHVVLTKPLCFNDHFCFKQPFYFFVQWAFLIQWTMVISILCWFSFLLSMFWFFGEPLYFNEHLCFNEPFYFNGDLVVTNVFITIRAIVCYIQCYYLFKYGVIFNLVLFCKLGTLSSSTIFIELLCFLGMMPPLNCYLLTSLSVFFPPRILK